MRYFYSSGSTLVDGSVYENIENLETILKMITTAIPFRLLRMIVCGKITNSLLLIMTEYI